MNAAIPLSCPKIFQQFFNYIQNLIIILKGENSIIIENNEFYKDPFILLKQT